VEGFESLEQGISIIPMHQWLIQNGAAIMVRAEVEAVKEESSDVELTRMYSVLWREHGSNTHTSRILKS
jgi:hypothetical protein